MIIKTAHNESAQVKQAIIEICLHKYTLESCPQTNKQAAQGIIINVPHLLFR